jgi:hypothetical protein
MSNVVGLNGPVIDPARKPNADAIDLCEKLLERARSGEVNTIAAFAGHHDECVSFQICGNITYRLLGLMTSETSLIAHHLATADEE